MITANQYRDLYKTHDNGDTFKTNGEGFFLKSEFLRSLSLSDLDLSCNSFEDDIENGEFAEVAHFGTYYFYERSNIGYKLGKIAGIPLNQSDIDFLLHTIKDFTNSHSSDGVTFSKPLHSYIYKKTHDGAVYMFGNGDIVQLDRYKNIQTFGYRRFNNYIEKFKLPFKAIQYKDSNGELYWIITRL